MAICAVGFVGGTGRADDWHSAASQLAAQIDAKTNAYWDSAGVSPAADCGDLTFLRRVSLDTLGRIPTDVESKGMSTNPDPARRSILVRQSIESPEFALHWGDVLDGMIQGKHAGDQTFVNYLRGRISSNQTWDALFREVLLGPFDQPELSGADRFLSRRIQSADEMTNDISRVFFGVDISCAKCHDHPLVEDWKQQHYFGLTSFFNRTFLFNKDNKSSIAEKEEGIVEFVDREGNRQQAKLMFLSGQMLEEPVLTVDDARKAEAEKAEKEGRYLPPRHSRREQLIKVALEERRFFSRAFVNHVWNELLGRGLVHPAEQMHSANLPAIPEVLDLLADDQASQGYDLKRLIGAIMMSRVYQLSSVWTGPGDRPEDKYFAVRSPRPLTPMQLATSLAMLSRDQAWRQAPDAATRGKLHLEMESTARDLSAWLDVPTDEFQSSVTEALFFTNSPKVKELLTTDGSGMIARLQTSPDDESLIGEASWSVWGRPTNDEERGAMLFYLTGQGNDRAKGCQNLIWAMIASAEFRFNY